MKRILPHSFAKNKYHNNSDINKKSDPFREIQQMFHGCTCWRRRMIQFHINIIVGMNFHLENASFSDNDDEENDLLMPSTQMIKEYNREYSMIVGEIEHFLKEVKESVQRFVAFHNYGVGLNLPALFQTLITTDQLFKNRLLQADNTNTDPKHVAKGRYESTFHRLFQKMGELLKEFIDCELEFKKQYFGLKEQRQDVRRNLLRARSTSPQNYSASISSLTKSSKSSHIEIQQFKESEQREEKREAELRAMLNERLQPKPTSLEIECKSEYSTTQNLYRLNEKIDRIYEDMRTIKGREEKLIELFNLNRVKKDPQALQEPPPFPSTDVSAIEASETDEVDSFLEGCRPIMKDLDTITEKGHHPKGRSFMKRAPTFLAELNE